MEKEVIVKWIYQLRIFFNRILVGTLSSDKKKITTTHSYYDCSNTKDYINLKKNKFR